VLTEELTGWVQWSPTSDRIAVLTASRVGDSGPELDLELAMMDGTGSSHEVIAELGRCACLGLAPGFAWAPDGTMLVVDMPGPDASSPPPDAGGWGVYLMDDTGTVLRQIRGEGGSGDPAWQPVMSPAY